VVIQTGNWLLQMRFWANGIMGIPVSELPKLQPDHFWKPYIFYFTNNHNIMADKQSMELKVIDLTKPSFTANGKEYFIEKSLSQERFLMYQKLQIELTYQTGFAGMYNSMKKLYELLNDKKFVDSAVIVHNALNGVKNTEERRIPALELAALFVNEKDEDRKTINQDMVDKKLKDWELEGLDVTPFFQLAISSIAGFKEIYSELIRKSLEEVL
jgi:hypothetical protein